MILQTCDTQKSQVSQRQKNCDLSGSNYGATGCELTVDPFASVFRPQVPIDIEAVLQI
jgi:hypothetical protein